MRYKAIVLCVVAVLLVVPVICPGQIIAQKWYFNDGPGTAWWWGDVDPALGPFWEWMDSLAIAPGDTACAFADVLQPPQEYYATSQVEANSTYWCHFWAEIYLANNYPAHNNPVYAALGYGAPGNAASFVQVAPTVTVNVTSYTPGGCGTAYTFDFGMPASFQLVNQALIVKIWTTVPPGDVHVYWDSWCCPSALYVDCTVPVEERTWGKIKQLYRE